METEIFSLSIGASRNGLYKIAMEVLEGEVLAGTSDYAHEVEQPRKF